MPQRSLWGDVAGKKRKYKMWYRAVRACSIKNRHVLKRTLCYCYRAWSAIRVRNPACICHRCEQCSKVSADVAITVRRNVDADPVCWRINIKGQIPGIGPPLAVG